MTRENHQPQGERPERPRRGGDELRAACGRAVAFVLAFDDVAAHGVNAGVDAAAGAKTPAVFVLAAPAVSDKVAQSVYSVRRRGRNTPIQVMALDPGAVREATRAAADFELFGLPCGLLDTMRMLADSVLPDYEAALVLDAAMDSILPDHLYELCSELKGRPDAEAVASWIQWLRRPPYAVSRTFLEGLDGSPLTQRGPSGDRPVPRICVVDHVFGEEKLAPAASVPQLVEAFLENCSMTALQAVHLARWVKAHPGEEPTSPNQPLSLTEPAGSQPLSDADRLLLDVASEVVGRMDAVADEELAWADGFAMRNHRDFPLLNDRAHAGRLAYLDSAATSQRLGAALRAQSEFDLHGNANVYRGAYELSAQATFAYNAARKRIEDFIGAERRSIAFCANTTAACNLVAQAWGEWNVGAGDLVVTTIAEHHSNMLPLMLLAERKGAVVEHVPLGPDGRIDMRAYHAALARGPKLVAVAHVGNVMGIEAPVREMAGAARAAGARFLLDAAQSFPHRVLDVRELGADWVAFSAHKAYGPMGIGALWSSPAAFAEMDPISAGGGTISHASADSYYLRPKSIQYEPGTPPVSQAIGWAAAVDYLDALGMENVARHAAACTRYLVAGLHEVDGASVMGDHSAPDGQTGLVSFTVRSAAPGAVAHFLGELGVAVRSGGHCALPLHAALGLIGTGRISVAVHTTRADIDAALVAITLCRHLFEAR